jgi:hypothetical protein
MPPQDGDGGGVALEIDEFGRGEPDAEFILYCDH